jgi:pyruvate/2-oxoglutarate dehydrogenase complex dihydrolipoamide acyltransferase (E2) component
MEIVMACRAVHVTERFALIASFVSGALIATIAAASAQVPTTAQQHALRANCVSDYRANCATVPTGGMAALVCLEQHVDKLSPACKGAVLAAEGHAPDESAAKAPAKPAASSAAPTKSASATPPPATPAPEMHAAPPPKVLPFFMEVRLAARACATDFRLLCPGVPLGQGNAIFCLKVHAQKLDPVCRKALVEAGERLE